MKSLLLFLLLISIIGCTQTKDGNFHYKDFPETIALKATVVKIDTALFRYPFRIRIANNRAIIMDLHNADYFYHLFNYPGFKYLSSFGKRGQSPKDMLSAENFRINGSLLYTLDANKREIKTFEFSGNRDSLLLQSSVAIEEAILRPLDFVQYNDNTFLIPDYSGENRFCWVNKEGIIMERTGTIPSKNTKAMQSAKTALSQAWRSFIDYNPDNGIFAMATQLGEVLEIYNFKDSTHTVIVGPAGEPEFQMSGNYAVPSGIMGFSDIRVTGKYIYAVFHGRSFKELQQQKELIDGGQFIYVFDLQGNPVRKYILDRFIYGINVDEVNQVIWATDVNNDQPIVEFDIPR